MEHNSLKSQMEIKLPMIQRKPSEHTIEWFYGLENVDWSAELVVLWYLRLMVYTVCTFYHVVFCLFKSIPVTVWLLLLKLWVLLWQSCVYGCLYWHYFPSSASVASSDGLWVRLSTGYNDWQGLSHSLGHNVLLPFWKCLPHCVNSVKQKKGEQMVREAMNPVNRIKGRQDCRR